MIRLRLSELAAWVPAALHGGDATVGGVSIDSSTLQPGDLFVALKGPRFDGHDYLEEAAEKGAVGALVSERLTSRIPCLEVADTRLGLGRVASAWRDRSPARVVAITGSNGKTTVKEMLAAMLSQEGQTLATRGNLNNDIGLPLTLCRLQDEKFAVLELGANHPGEIDYLSRIARPDIALINNAGRAHLEGFGSVEGVARAKAEILNGLDPSGLFIFNADDDQAPLWRELARGRRQMSFAVHRPADITSPAGSLQLHWDAEGFHSKFEVHSPRGVLQVSMALTGEHNRMNALVAIAAAQGLGVSDESILRGLAEVQPVAGRLAPRVAQTGARVVDDSYNANPDSVRMAVEVLCQAPGRRLLVLGDLGELGPEAGRLHGELGIFASDRGVDMVFTCGVLSEATARAFGTGGCHFETQEALLETLRELLRAEDTVLVKGSRAAAMEKVVAALCGEERSC